MATFCKKIKFALRFESHEIHNFQRMTFIFSRRNRGLTVIAKTFMLLAVKFQTVLLHLLNRPREVKPGKSDKGTNVEKIHVARLINNEDLITSKNTMEIQTSYKIWNPVRTEQKALHFIMNNPLGLLSDL